MSRFNIHRLSVAVDTVPADADEILCGEFVAGMIFVPAGSTITSITWYAAPVASGTFLPAYDEDGAAVVQAVAAGNAYALPGALSAAVALKAVGDADGEIDLCLRT